MIWALLVVGLVNAWALAYLGRRGLDGVLQRWDRRLTLEERGVALKEQQARSSTPPAIPSDLLRRVTRWQDPVAQESERTVLLSLFEEFRDRSDPWADVRSHLPPEPSEEYASPLLS